MSLSSLERPTDNAPDLLARRLSHGVDLHPDEFEALRDLTFAPRTFRRGQAIVDDGAAITDLQVVVSGTVGRMQFTRKGRRQLVAILLPGDVFDWPLFHLNARASRDLYRLNDSICSLSACKIAACSAASVLQAVERAPLLERAFEAYALAEQDIARAWMLNLGSRAAPERIGHLFCELLYRMRAVGLASGGSCHLPLTQGHIADALGLSLVHVNRLLRDMAQDGILTFGLRTLLVPDLPRLERWADFNSRYLRGSGAWIEET